MESFSYSNPMRMTYSWGSLNFVSGAGSWQIQPPPLSKAARVADISVRVTTLFTNVTTGALVNIGTAATAAKYVSFNCGAAAANTTINLNTQGGSPFNPVAAGFIGDGSIDLTRDAVTFIQVQVVAPTGGSPAGVGFLDIAMAWF